MSAPLNNLANFPNEHQAIKNLLDSGLTRETLSKFPILFLDSQSTNEDRLLYLADTGKHLIQEKTGACNPCLLFHYPHVKDYGIVRHVPPIPDKPKYLSPHGKSKHLYIISTRKADNPFQWEPNPKDRFLFVEGIKKGLKLWQELIDDNKHRYVIVILDGVGTFYTSPEHRQIISSIKDKDVYLVFDADADENRDVRREELTLFAYLRNCEARKVLSFRWNLSEGKGIDDVLAQNEKPAEYLQTLIDNAVDPLTKFHSTGTDERVICEYLARAEKHTHLSKSVCNAFAKDLKALCLMPISDLRQILQDKIKDVQNDALQSKIDAQSHAVKSLFGIDYDLTFPQGYTVNNGKLSHLSTSLCDLFVLSHYVENVNTGEECLYQIRFASGKTVDVSSDDLGDPRRLAQTFNRNRQAVDIRKAKGIASYLSDFWSLNSEKIPVKTFYTNTGWTTDGKFRLPALFPNDVFSEDIRQGFTPAGIAEQQIKFVVDVITKEPEAGVYLLMMLAAPIVSRLKLPKFVVNLHGASGFGKTTLLDMGASLIGNPERLVKSADATKVGRELMFTLYNDLPVFIDELKTGAQDGKGIAKQILSLIFNYTSGKQRLRGNVRLQVQKSEEFNGVLFTSANRSIESMLDFAETDTDGAHRRVLDVQIDHLWNDQSKEAFSARYEQIKNHYGNVFPRWINHLQQGGIERIREAYQKPCTLDQHNCKGTEKLIKLAWVVLPEFLACFCPDMQKTNVCEHSIVYEALLQDIATKQANIVKQHTEGEAERFQSAFFEFIAEERDKCIFTTKDTMQRKTYCIREHLLEWDSNGEECPTESPNHFFLTPTGVKAFCHAHQFEKRRLRDILRNKQILIDERASKKLAGMPIKAWKLKMDDE